RLGKGDCGGFDVDAGEAAAAALDQVQRWPARAAGDVEDVASRAAAQQLGDQGLLGHGAPALLAEIDAIDLAAHLPRQLPGEPGILRAVENEPAALIFRHRHLPRVRSYAGTGGSARLQAQPQA